MFMLRKDLFHEENFNPTILVSFILASCGGKSNSDKNTLNVEIP